MDRRKFLGASAVPLFMPITAACAQAVSGTRVYVGEPFSEPEEKPVPVYNDAALTERAKQPLRAIGDRPGKVYTALSSYSLSVRDSQGRQIAYIAEASGLALLHGVSVSRSAAVGSTQASHVPHGVPSVRDFGAKGDGVADDTAAIQKALDSLDHNGALFFPTTGTAFYKVSRSLRLPSRVGLTLYGPPGRKPARIRLVGGTASTDILRRADPSTAEANNINDTSIIGLGFEASGPSRHAINLTCMSRSVIRDCHFDSVAGAAIYALSSLSCVVTGCRANACGEFILQDNTSWTGLNGWLVAGNYIGLMERWGVDIRIGMTGSSFNGNTIESCKLGGIRLRQDCHGISVSGNYLEHNRAERTNSTDIYIAETSYCRAIVVEGNYFNGSDEASDYYYPIRMGYADGCRISHNMLNTGSKFIKVETPNSSNNEIGPVSFHAGAFRLSSEPHATLNLAGRSVEAFRAARNRINL